MRPGSPGGGHRRGLPRIAHQPGPQSADPNLRTTLAKPALVEPACRSATRTVETCGPSGGLEDSLGTNPRPSVGVRAGTSELLDAAALGAQEPSSSACPHRASDLDLAAP